MVVEKLNPYNIFIANADIMCYYMHCEIGGIARRTGIDPARIHLLTAIVRQSRENVETELMTAKNIGLNSGLKSQVSHQIIIRDFACLKQKPH